MEDHRLAALPKGYRLREYRIGPILGLDDSGVSYVALDKDKRRFAIKEFLPVDLAVREGEANVVPLAPGARTRYRRRLDAFLHESNVLALLSHPNIVRVVHVFQANGTGYRVMPFEEGATLEATLRRREDIDEMRLWKILVPLLDGLERVHGAGVWHGRIHARNVIVRHDGSPVLVGFGPRPGLSRRDHSRDRPDRLAPGPWHDTAALAAMLYEVVARHPPASRLVRLWEDARSHARERVGGNGTESGTAGAGPPVVPAIAAGRGRYTHDFLLGIDAVLGAGRERAAPTAGAWRDRLAPPGRPGGLTHVPLGIHPVPRPGLLLSLVITQRKPAPDIWSDAGKDKYRFLPVWFLGAVLWVAVVGRMVGDFMERFQSVTWHRAIEFLRSILSELPMP